jgi:hypothetical protein
MGKYSKLREKILAGSADGNIDLSALALMNGSREIIIFLVERVSKEIINLQPKGSKAKPYQIKQVRSILVEYRLGESDVD